MLPNKSMCIIYMLHIGLSHIWQCNIIAFLYHLWLIFCPCHVLSLFHVKISPPVESVYWFHIVIILPSPIIFSHLCGVNFILCGSLSLICYEQWSAICVVCYVQCSALGVVSLLYHGRDFGDRSDLKELQGKQHYTPEGSWRWCAARNLCLAGIC